MGIGRVESSSSGYTPPESNDEQEDKIEDVSSEPERASQWNSSESGQETEPTNLNLSSSEMEPGHVSLHYSSQQYSEFGDRVYTEAELTAAELRKINIPIKKPTDDLDKKMKAMATKGMKKFISQVVTNPVGMAIKSGELSLMCGIASSAIAQVVDGKEDAFEWLAFHGGSHLAKWVKDQSQRNKFNIKGDTVNFGKELNRYINGVMSKDQKRITGIHPDVGEDIIRLLQSLQTAQLLKKTSVGDQRPVLRMFGYALDELENSKLPNSYIFNYTIQLVAIQSNRMLMEQASGVKQTMLKKFKTAGKEIATINDKLDKIINKPTIFIKINTGGGTYIGGSVEIGRDFIGGNQITQTSFCCSPEEANAG